MRIPRDRAFRQALRRFHRPWYRRLLPWAMIVGALCIAGRVAVGPLVERWSRDALAQLQGFHGSYQRVDVFSWPPVYVVDGLRIESDTGAQVASVERLEVHTDLGDVVAAALWHRVPTVRVRLARPRVLLDGGTPVVLARELEAWAAAQLPAVNVELAKVEDGEILLGPGKGGDAGTTPGKLTTFMAALNASALRTDPEQPLVVKGTAALLGSGDSSFHLRMPADPAAAVSGDLFLRYLTLGDVYWLVEQPLPPGEVGRTLAIAARFTLDDSELHATVRATSENLGPNDLPSELVERVRSRFAGAAPWVIAERKPAEDPTALTVQGSLSPAGTGRWLQSLSAVRTLFAEGVGAASTAVVTSVSPGGAAHAAAPATHAPVVAGSPVSE
jgi:hypothetical protein